MYFPIIVSAFVFVFWVVIFSPGFCLADGWAASGPAQSAATTESSNFKKSERFLAGEEVKTPTGKTMKVWSTEGPVPVARPPEPFETQEQSVVDGVDVIVDPYHYRRKKREHLHRLPKAPVPQAPVNRQR